MPNDEHEPSGHDDRLNAYAAWVSELRHGKSVPLPPTDAADPLAKLGHELNLLSDLITRRESELERLFQVVHTVERGILLEDVLDRIFVGFSGIIPYDRIGCAFLSEGGAELTAYWARSDLGLMQITKGYSQPLAASSLREVFRTGQPRVLNNLAAYLAANPGSNSTRLLVGEGCRSSLTCPLYLDGRPLGVLFFTSRKENVYRDIHQVIFGQIAEGVATVINKGRLFQKLVDNNQFLVRQAEQLKEVANRDALTGVLNRGAFLVTLERQIRASAAVGKTLGLIMADIDHFKEINDTYGHAAGDFTLCEFANRLAAMLRHSDYLGRYGGEEFLLLVGETSVDELTQIADCFRLAIADMPFELGTASRRITASFGLVLVSEFSEPEAVIAVADRALYAAKTSGRNCCVLAL